MKKAFLIISHEWVLYIHSLCLRDRMWIYCLGDAEVQGNDRSVGFGSASGWNNYHGQNEIVKKINERLLDDDTGTATMMSEFGI